MDDLTDIQLVKRCKNEDDTAFDQLVERYQLPMYRTAKSIVGDPDQAKDVTQNGFIKAWKNIDSFNSDYRFFSWLYRIIVNEALNHNRDTNNAVSLSSTVADETTPHQQVVKTQEKRLVKKAIQQLKPHYRVVIHLRHFEELSYKEIADILDIKVKTVKSRLYTARSNLRKIISQYK